ncbi:MAG: zinc ribbon domain-containing protein [Dehalococcoidales bacterium]|nr:zinc ribbon domain-containing protein [Dehalococcoidales bacterium]
METLIAVLLAGTVLAYIGYPLLKPRVPDEEQTEIEETELDEVLAQKETTLSAIAELDFDHAMGNLSEKDYRELRERYKLKALILMKQEDELAEIEEESDAEDTQASSDESADGPRDRRTQRRCASCGTAVDADDRFCARCGAKTGGRGCPGCGTAYEPDDAFCANCGHRLPAKGRK